MESLLTPRPPDTQEQPVILYSVSTGTPAPGGLQIELLQKQVPRDQREADQGAQAGLQGEQDRGHLPGEAQPTGGTGV